MEQNIRSAIESTINEVLIPTRLIPSWIDSLRNLLLNKNFVITIKQVYSFTTIKKQNELPPGEYKIVVSLVETEGLVSYTFHKVISITYEDTTDTPNNPSMLYKPIINVNNTPFTLSVTHSHSLIVVDTPTNVTLILPSNLSAGFNVTVIQKGIGTVIFQPNSPSLLFNNNNHNSTKERYSVCNLYVSRNLNGFSAQYVLDGSTKFTAVGSTPTEPTEPGTPTLSIVATNATRLEGNSGTTSFTFTVTRTVNTTGISTANWAVTGTGANPANAADFVGSVFPSGTVTFAAGVTSQVITINVQGDMVVEADETFTVTLSNPSNAIISTATAIGTIQNDNNNTNTQPSLVGSYDTSGDAWDVQVVGNYAYVTYGDVGLLIINISDPTNPTLTGGYETPTDAYGLQVVGNYAYVADWSAGLQIIDIRNPANPTLTGGYNTSGNAVDVQVVGNYAYVADYSAGLQIIDIRNPANPTLTGGYNTSGNAVDVQVVGNYAYVADYSAGLQIIDIRNPALPTLTGVYNTSGDAQDVQVVGNYAYVADGSAGLQIIDISNPANPTLTGVYNTSGYAQGVQVVGNYAYVADQTAGLQIIDISNPANPTLTSSYDTSGYAYDLRIVGNYAYVAANNGGLQIIDVSAFTQATSPFTTPTLSINTTSSLQLVEVGTVSLVSSTSLVLVSPVLNPDKLNVGSIVYNSSGASASIQTKTLTTIYTISNVQGLWSIGDKVYVAETVGSEGIAVSQFEGDSGITPFLFTVTRSGDLRGVTTVNWAVSASGTNPANQFDFQGSVFPSGVITFAPGVATQVITVNVQGDAIVEPNETFQVTLFNPQNGTVINSVAQGVIINNDNFFVPPDLNQNIIIDQQVRSQLSVEETKQTLRTSINTPEAEIFLTPLIISARPLNQSFDNEIVRIEVSFTERPVGQPDYNFLAKQDENGAFFLLKNNPGPGEIGVVFRDRNQNGRIDGATLFLKDRISESQTVRETGDLDPRPGYILDPVVPVVISSLVSDLRLAWLSNNDSSATQRFLTWLSASDNTNSGSAFLSWLPPTTATETLPLVSFSTPNLSLPEGINNQSTVFNFQVIRTRQLNVITTVSWAVVGTGSSPANASDFVGNAFPTGVLTFQIGQSTQTISVLVQGDDQLEPNETFSVILSNPVNGEIGNGVAIGTILNDDSEPTLAIVATDAIKLEGNAGITYFLFDVNRFGNLNFTATVNWAVTGTGSNPSTANDFANGVFPSGFLTFAPGQSNQAIAVPVQSDTIVESNETFTVTLSNATNAIITSATATGTIINDDQESPTPTLSPTVTWARLLGTAARDEIFAAKTTADGSIIVSGQTFGNFDNPTLINNDSQVFLAKYSSGGIRDWTRQLNSTNPTSNDTASGMDIAADGSIYVTGTTQGNLVDQGLIGGRDAFLAKYNSLGSLAWVRLLGTTADDRGNSVVVGVDGFIYIVGSTDGTFAGQTNAGQADTFIAKYDPNGNRAWLSLLGTSGTDIGYSISTSTEGSIYVAGMTTSSISPETGFGSNDAFLAKYNPDGTRSWVRQLGTDKIDQGLAVTVGSDGFIYIAGETQGNLHGEANPSSIVSSAFLSKYNSSGTRIWTKILGTATTDAARAIAASSNSIFISGFTYGDLDGQVGAGWARAFVSKYNLNGERVWTRLLNSTANTFANTLTTDSQGAIYVAGRTQSSILEGQVKEVDVYSNFDAFLVKIQES